MKRTDLCWKTGEVIYWDLDSIEEAEPLNRQSENLKEDLAQIRYQDGTLLDIGWCPSFDPSGKFIVTVVSKENWQSPIFYATAKDISELRQQVSNGIAAMELANRQ